MNEEQHVIKFKYSFGLYKRLISNNDIYIDEYENFGSRIDIGYGIDIGSRIIIYYNNLNIYNSIFSNNRFDYIFNLSNILYKLHTKDYYCRYNHNCKELI